MAQQPSREFASTDPTTRTQVAGFQESGFSRRISSATFGLPPRDREFHRQNKRKPARCQRMTVSGLTITKVLFFAAH
jgi:hypothetical protein